MRRPLEDYYLILGVARAASAGEVRRAFRLLALRHHPDRAGEGSTSTFQRIAEAYAVLSDPNSRAAYDGLREGMEVRGSAPPRRRTGGGARAARAADAPGAAGGEEGSAGSGVGSGVGRGPDGAAEGGAGGGVEEGMYEGPGGRIGWRRPRRYTRPSERPIIDRLCGSLDDLLSREVARRGRDGIVEITITRAEAESGGVAAIDARVPVRCPTCSGLAERDVLWCQRCHHAGTVLDDVTFHLMIPSAVRDRTIWTFTTDPSGQTPPFRVRVRIAAVGRGVG
jgi:DnaJ-class molecular chaperone